MVKKDQQEADALLAEIHREFREGLAGRLGRLHTSLERLAAGYEREAAETFYRTAHSLKGTAPAFDAHGLVEPASELSSLGRRWFEEEAVNPKEIPEARELLARLSAETERFIAEKEGKA